MVRMVLKVEDSGILEEQNHVFSEQNLFQWRNSWCFPTPVATGSFCWEDVAEISVSAAVNDLPDEVRDPSSGTIVPYGGFR